MSRRVTPWIAGWIAGVLAAGCCAGGSARPRDPLAYWQPARARVRAWTGCELPTSATEIDSDGGALMTSIVDVRFTAPPEEIDRFLDCWRHARDALLPRSIGSALRVRMPAGVTDLRTASLAYDTATRFRTIEIEIGDRGPERFVRIATVEEPSPTRGGPPRGPPGTVLER